MNQPLEQHTAPTNLPMFTNRTNRPHARSLAGTGVQTPPPPPPPVRAGHQPPPVSPDPTHLPAPSTPAMGLVDSAPTRLPALSDGLRAAPVDQRLVRTLAAKVYNSWKESTPGVVDFRDKLDPSRHGDAMREHIDTHIREYVHAEANHGRTLPFNDKRALEREVYDSLFGLGPLQKLLDMPGLINLDIYGHDQVWLDFSDGRITRGPSVGESDQDLLDMVKQFARTAGTEKEWSPAAPSLRMSLHDGSRLAADAWVTNRPQVHIRRHTYIDATLETLQQSGMMTTGIRQFIASCMLAGLNIIVSGVPGTGKTTLTRAVLRTLPPMVAIATIEATYELGLHLMPELHPRVWAAEARPAGENGGEVTLTDLFSRALQVNADRFVIGEVTGEESGPMIQAMQGGRGSISTVHADNGWDTVERLVTLLIRHQANLDSHAATRMVAQNVDVIVHVNKVTLPGGRPMPVVDEILTVERNDDQSAATAATMDYLWKRGDDGRATATGARPPWLSRLTTAGFDADWLQPHADDWETLETMARALDQGGAA